MCMGCCYIFITKLRCEKESIKASEQEVCVEMGTVITEDCHIKISVSANELGYSSSYYS